MNARTASIDEAAELLRQIVGPVQPRGGAVKDALRIATTRTGLKPGRAYKLWYRLAAIVASEEMDHLRAVAQRINDMNAASLERLRNPG